jgi:RNA polymerase sigma-70 factor, ECF subfamily
MKGQERDLHCVLRIQEGDERALEQLYDRYATLLFPVVSRILGNAAEAEDALQEAWLQVWRRAPTYDPRRGTVVAWLLTLARSRALDRRRSAASRKRAQERVEAEPQAAPASPAAAGSLANEQLSKRVREALGTLDPRQRYVLEVAYFEGLSQSEIALKLQTPLGTVKSWTRQGLMRLREMFPREEWT